MRRLVAAALALLWAGGAAAQPSVTLVADAVRIEGRDRLIAEGEVEVTYEGRRLTARRITYDRGADRVTIEGPLTLIDGPDAILLADAAAIDADLRDGILTGARLVLDRRLQLAASRVVRAEGRLTELSRVVASSCEVCAARPRPLWEIRPRRVVHDEARGTLVFEGAQFRLGGVPLAYIPRLRLPDPSRERAAGLLVPRLRSSSRLGTGIKLPYFLPLGPSADLTFTPYLSPDTRTLEARYRQAFARGALVFEGAVSDDNTEISDPRGYLFGEAAFRLPGDVALDFDVETVTDAAYLSDYGYSDADRLSSTLALSRTRTDAYARARLTSFRTLRPAEIRVEETLPRLYADAEAVRIWRRSVLGGDVRLSFDSAALTRTSDAPDDGRDVGRTGVALGWRRQEVMGPGLVADGGLGLDLDLYRTVQDPAFDDFETRATPRIMAGLAWPLARSRPGGAGEVLEPRLQLVWQRDADADVPNEDSRLVTLDEGNLFAQGRYPGEDRIETGLRADLGVAWRRFDPAGWSSGATLGRVVRLSGEDQFDGRTGLEGTWSDWLVAGELAAGGWRMDGRALVDEDGTARRRALRLAYAGGAAAIGASYLYAAAGAGEPDDARLREAEIDALVSLTPAWTATLDGRFDFEADRAQRAGFGLRYENECISVALSLSRRFTSSDNVRATTDAGLSVALTGFGARPGTRIRRGACAP